MKKIQEDVLGNQLRAEGLANGPEFVPLLHERIKGVLRAKGLGFEQPKEAGASHGRWAMRIAGALGVAAAVGVVAWVALWTPASSNPPTTDGQLGVAAAGIPSFAPGDLVQPVRENVTAPTVEAWEQGKYAYLDKDARRFMIFVADQIPTFEIERK